MQPVVLLLPLLLGYPFTGTKRKEIHIPQFYIDGIEKLQKAMQNFVSERGIGIETNPTSNYLISVMNSYEEHPILRFYNKGLDADYEEKYMFAAVCICQYR